MATYGLIGGTGLEDLVEGAKEGHRRTRYGPVDFTVGEIGGEKVFLVLRHGKNHRFPPHKVPYRANIWFLHKLGAERIIALNAVGSMNPDVNPGDLVVPNDFIDFTKKRSLTFYDKSPVTHIDMSTPYCPEVRDALIKAARRCGEAVTDRAVLVCTEGPRYETPAEIRMFRAIGCDVIGMTGVPEVTLARELGMCYATLCFVSNKAAGMQERLTTSEVLMIAERNLPLIKEVVLKAISLIPEKRTCACMHVLESARI